MLLPDLAAVVDGSDVIVLGSSRPAVLEALGRGLASGQVVIDTVGLKPDHPLHEACVVGLCW